MSEVPASAKSRLPTWARILVGLFIFGTVVSVGSIGVFAYMVAISGDPSRVKEILQSMAKVEDLPPGFRFDRGISLPDGDGVVLVVHEKDGTTFTIMKMPAVNNVDAKSLSTQLASAGTQYGGKLKVTSTGKETVAGKDFEYILGTVGSGTGKTIEQMRGALIIGNKRVMTLTGSTPSGPYNMEATKQLLGSIKGF